MCLISKKNVYSNTLTYTSACPLAIMDETTVYDAMYGLGESRLNYCRHQRNVCGSGNQSRITELIIYCTIVVLNY